MSTEYLVLVFMPCPRFVNGEYVSDFEMIRDEVALRLQKWSADDLDVYGFPVLEVDQDVLGREAALEHTEQVFLDYILEDAPGVQKIGIDDCRHHIAAGGMVGGYTSDDPSQEYRDILPVAACAIFEEAFGAGDQMAV